MGCDRVVPLSLASVAIFSWSLAEMPMMILGERLFSSSNLRTIRVNSNPSQMGIWMSVTMSSKVSPDNTTCSNASWPFLASMNDMLA